METGDKSPLQIAPLLPAMDNLVDSRVFIMGQPDASISDLIPALQEARARTLDLVADLSDEQMLGPRLDIVNPLRWEVAHVAWFQEYWVLRHLRGLEPVWKDWDQALCGA